MKMQETIKIGLRSLYSYKTCSISKIKNYIPNVILFLGLMIPVLEGGLVDTSLAPGDFPPWGLFGPLLSCSWAVRTGENC